MAETGTIGGHRKHGRRGAWLLVVVVLTHLAASHPARGASHEPLSGSALDEQLRRPMTALWQATPLRELLDSLSRSQRVAVLLDRRVDPDQRVSVTARDQSLAAVLATVAESLGLGLSRVGDIFYLGPPDAARDVRTIVELARQEAAALPADLRKRCEAMQSTLWPELAEPRVLVTELAREAGLECSPEAAIAHDLWPAALWPAQPWYERIALILVQFDLMQHVSADRLRLELAPRPRRVAIERRYDAGPDARGRLAQWQTMLADAQMQIVGRELIVRARVEHEQLAAPPAAHSHTPAPLPAAQAPTAGGDTLAQRRFTLRSPNKPLRALLGALGQVGIAIECDEAVLAAAGKSLDTVVSVSVEEATIDELLVAWLEPLGLAYERRGTQVTIVPR